MEANTGLDILTILKQIRDEISLLTVTIKADSINKFYQQFLTTEQRKLIYELFNGERDVVDIAKEVNCTPRNIQMFIKELEDKDLIDIEKKGKSKVPIKSITKIALYYNRN